VVLIGKRRVLVEVCRVGVWIVLPCSSEASSALTWRGICKTFRSRHGVGGGRKTRIKPRLGMFHCDRCSGCIGWRCSNRSPSGTGCSRPATLEAGRSRCNTHLPLGCRDIPDHISPQAGVKRASKSPEMLPETFLRLRTPSQPDSGTSHAQKTKVYAPKHARTRAQEEITTDTSSEHSSAGPVNAYLHNAGVPNPS